jgi:dimethylargininase
MKKNNMKYTQAITRVPCRNFANGISTANFGEPDYNTMLKQHENYVSTLRSLGLDVEVLSPLLDFPDSHFVEDVAVVTPDVAIITNPGAKARTKETEFIVAELSEYRDLIYIQAPGTLDGGDILMIDAHFFIGVSDRTNLEGANQIAYILDQLGNSCSLVPVGQGLHLKSSVNYIGKNSLIISRDFSTRPEFHNYEKIVVDPNEEYTCNTLWINDTLLFPKGYHNTKQKLTSLYQKIIELDVSEARKMDGGLTCLSLRF